jgi:DNA-binding IclR family transcriptional regulator
MKINRTTHRATEILKLLATSPDSLTISEIAERLGLPKTSTFDIVQTLKYAHFLRETNKRFYIGFMASEVGEAYKQDKELFGIAKPKIVALADQMKMACSLVIWEKEALDYVIEYVPEGVILTPASSGGRNFLHASASGKALIAHMSAAKQKKAFEMLSFVPFTDRTIRNLETFKEEIARTKQRGYGLDNCEWHELVTCVSVPIFSLQKVVAVLTLSGIQIDPATIKSISQKLKETSEEITQKLEFKKL